jgi:pyruvate/2-oxoglutarate dehydrogenase complex dihydrolipoamide acyltransferase (E2) component
MPCTFLPQHSVRRAPCVDALHYIVSCTASCRLVLQVGEILADIHVEGGEGDLELHSPPAAAAAEAAGGGGPAAHQQQHRGDPRAPGTGAAVGCRLSAGSGLQQTNACSMHAFTAMLRFFSSMCGSPCQLPASSPCPAGQREALHPSTSGSIGGDEVADRVLTSPAVRRLAREHGISLTQV